MLQNCIYCFLPYLYDKWEYPFSFYGNKLPTSYASKPEKMLGIEKQKEEYSFSKI